MNTKDEELEEAWELLQKTLYSEQEVNRDKFISNPLKTLSYYMEFSMYPPPEVLIELSNTYDKYMAFKGEMDLEEAFFGKPQKGKGNFSSRTEKVHDVHMMELNLAFNQLDGNKSQYKVAE